MYTLLRASALRPTHYLASWMFSLFSRCMHKKPTKKNTTPILPSSLMSWALWSPRQVRHVIPQILLTANVKKQGIEKHGNLFYTHICVYIGICSHNLQQRAIDLCVMALFVVFYESLMRMVMMLGARLYRRYAKGPRTKARRNQQAAESAGTVREFQLRNERALDRLSCVAHSENYLKVLVPLALSTGREDPSRVATHPSGGGWMASSSLVFSLSEQSKRKEGRRSQAPWPQLLHQPPLP